MRPTLCSLFNRRDFALISRTEMFGESSIKMGAWDKTPAASVIFIQSSWVMNPLLKRDESILASLLSIRNDSCSLDISRENMATAELLSTAAFFAILSAKAVFPIPGRPARIIRSDFCKPAVNSSSLVNPVATPVTSALFP